MNEQERIQKLENEMVEVKITQKVHELSIGELRATVKEIKSNTNKIVWLVGSALILAVLNFIFRGGLS